MTHTHSLTHTHTHLIWHTHAPGEGSASLFSLFCFEDSGLRGSKRWKARRRWEEVTTLWRRRRGKRCRKKLELQRLSNGKSHFWRLNLYGLSESGGGNGGRGAQRHLHSSPLPPPLLPPSVLTGNHSGSLINHWRAVAWAQRSRRSHDSSWPGGEVDLSLSLSRSFAFSLSATVVVLNMRLKLQQL